MKRLEEIGTCPKCQYPIFAYKTNQYKRFAKCEGCDTSYPLPKRGSFFNSTLICPERSFPVLIIEKKDQKAYFWSDQPCFTCMNFDQCAIVKSLVSEFEELEVYGY